MTLLDYIQIYLLIGVVCGLVFALFTEDWISAIAGVFVFVAVPNHVNVAIRIADFNLE